MISKANAQQLITFNNVSVTYYTTPRWLGGRPFQALNNISLSITDKSLAIVGPSGAGKSTLIELLFGLREPSEGSVNAFDYSLPVRSGKDKAALCQLMQLIPQEPHTSLNPYFTVRQILHEPLFNLGLTENADQVIRQALKDVGLAEELLLHTPQQLSTGQAQRVAIARALVVKPSVLVADEPTSSLDPVNRHRLIRLLQSLKQRHNMRLILVTHDLSAAHSLCDEVMVLNEGKVVEHNHTQQILNQPEHQVTQSLSQAQLLAKPSF